MPFPSVPIGAANLIGLIGGYRACGIGIQMGIDAHSDIAAASYIDEATKIMLEQAESDLKSARKGCAKQLEKLRRQKFDTWDRQLGRTVSLLEHIRNVELHGAPEVGELGAVAFLRADLVKMREVPIPASDSVLACVSPIGGIVLAEKARERLTAARVNQAKATHATSQMRAARSLVRGIHKVAKQVRSVLKRLDKRMTPVLDDLEWVIALRGLDYPTWPEADRRKVHLTVTFAQVLKTMLETPILTKKGKLTKTWQKPMADGRKLLRTRV